MPTVSLFPVHVEVGGEQHRTVRVYATDAFTEMWALVNGQPQVVATGAGLVKQARGMGHRFEDGTRARWVLQLVDGTEWLVSPAGGCGCSHPLKKFDPSKAVRT